MEQRAPLYALADLTVASQATADLTTAAVIDAVAPRYPAEL
jgi:hypothetical protein